KMPGLVDDAHAAPPQLAENFVSGNGRHGMWGDVGGRRALSLSQHMELQVVHKRRVGLQRPRRSAHRHRVRAAGQLVESGLAGCAFLHMPRQRAFLGDTDLVSHQTFELLTGRTGCHGTQYASSGERYLLSSLARLYSEANLSMRWHEGQAVLAIAWRKAG